jgi:hypothetical protein
MICPNLSTKLLNIFNLFFIKQQDQDLRKLTDLGLIHDNLKNDRK